MTALTVAVLLVFGLGSGGEAGAVTEAATATEAETEAEAEAETETETEPESDTETDTVAEPEPAAVAMAVADTEADTASPQDDAPLKVIATVPTYGALATAIGGELVDVVVLCRPGQDVHGVAATPSQMARVRSADLLLYTSLDSELWLSDLLRGSANTGLLPGSARAISLAEGVAFKEVPAVVDRSQGDVHPFGNPHIWSDPYLVRGMAARVADALVAALPAHADVIRERQQAFHTRLTQALVEWLTRLSDLKGRAVIVYHPSWIYFLDRFGIEQAGTIEPKPRVAPTASHLAELIELMKARDIRVIIREPFQAPDATEFLAKATGAEVVELATHPGFPAGTEDIIAHFTHNLDALATALRTADG